MRQDPNQGDLFTAAHRLTPEQQEANRKGMAAVRARLAEFGKGTAAAAPPCLGCEEHT